MLLTIHDKEVSIPLRFFRIASFDNSFLEKNKTVSEDQVLSPKKS